MADHARGAWANTFCTMYFCVAVALRALNSSVTSTLGSVHPLLTCSWKYFPSVHRETYGRHKTISNYAAWCARLTHWRPTVAAFSLSRRHNVIRLNYRTLTVSADKNYALFGSRVRIENWRFYLFVYTKTRCHLATRCHPFTCGSDRWLMISSSARPTWSSCLMSAGRRCGRLGTP